MTKSKYIGICMILLVIIIFTGCLDIKTTLKVKKDGSGTVEQTFLFSDAISEMMNSFSAMGGDEESTEPKPDFSSQLMDKTKLAEQAKNMGEGVALVSADPFKQKGFSGYKAIYSFKDVGKLKLNQNPSDLMPSDAAEAGGTSSAEAEFITFAFKKGTPATLTITMPQVEKPAVNEETLDTPDAEDSAMDDESAAMFKELYKDMRILIEVQVDGTVSDSNATNRKNNVITLMEMDFNKILEDQAKFDILVKSKADTLEEMKTLVKDIPGMKFEFQKSVNVKYK